MEQSILLIQQAAKTKLHLSNSPLKYLMSAILAGMFVGIGVISAFTSGTLVAALNPHMVPITMGLAFSMALTFILFSGSELFTANHFIFTISYLTKATKLTEAIKIWIYSLLGNLIGSILIASLIYGALQGYSPDIITFFHKATMAKLALPTSTLIFKAILCNVLVCTAVLLSFRIKSEVAKIIINGMCLFIFISAGFEHCIADAIIYLVSFIDNPHIYSINQLAISFFTIVLGNFIGGSFIIGGSYYLKSSASNKKAEEPLSELDLVN